MTKPHTLSYYTDGFTRVAFCTVCGAEGLLLLEDCAIKDKKPVENSLDEKNKTSK